MNEPASKRQMYRPGSSPTAPRYSGIRTFMRLPYITDLQGVDFAIAGVPFDTGGTYRVGSRFGPSAIRDESFIYKPYNPVLDVNIFDECSGVDYGDLPTIPGYLPEAHQLIEESAVAVFASGTTPIFLGGDHSVSLPLLRAAAAHYGPLALVHFDSHNDLHQGYFGGKDTHGTPIRRALEEHLIDPAHSLQIGIRGSLYDASVAREAAEAGLLVLTAPEMHRRGLDWVIETVRQRVGERLAYLTFDIDFVDPASAPGTGTPVVGGFNSAQSLELVRGLAGLNFIGYDLVEVLPSYDSAGITALLAAGIVYEYMSLIAFRKRLARSAHTAS